MDNLVHIAALVCVLVYASSAVMFTRGLVSQTLSLGEEHWGHRLYILGFTLHLVTVVWVLSSSTNESLTVPLVSIGLAGSFLLLRDKFRSLGAFVAPVVLSMFLLMSFMSHGEVSSSGQIALVNYNFLVKFHVGTTVIAHVFFSLLAILSLVYLIQESLLKRKRLHHLASKLPSIAKLDKRFLSSLSLGCLFKTLGIISGFFVLKENSLDFSGGDPRLLVSLVGLVFFSGLLVMRTLHGFRGKRLAFSSLLGFTLLAIFTYGLRFSSTFHTY